MEHYWNIYKSNDVFNFIESAKNDGRIKHIGFSYHDEFSLFKEIIDSYDWEFCQIQYNYMDRNYQAGEAGLKYAAEKGVPVVIMEPLKGGTLTTRVPKDIQAVWDRSEKKRSPAEWALQFLWNYESVNVVLSGMSNMEQVIENVKVSENGHANSLTGEELQLIDEVQKLYKSKIKVPCTGCGYCMPCPAGVNIPDCFIHLNNFYMYDDKGYAKMHYNVFVNPEERAINCAQCGKCEETCPQHINIREMLELVNQTLGEPE